VTALARPHRPELEQDARSVDALPTLRGPTRSVGAKVASQFMVVRAGRPEPTGVVALGGARRPARARHRASAGGLNGNKLRDQLRITAASEVSQGGYTVLG
jgi:hypothetical protein